MSVPHFAGQEGRFFRVETRTLFFRDVKCARMDGSGDEGDEIYCPSCGERIHRRVKYCRHCGEPNRKHPDSRGPGEPDRRDRREERGVPGGSDDTGRRGEGGRGAGQGYAGGRDADELGEDPWDYPDRPDSSRGPTDEATEPWERDRMRRVEEGIFEDEDPAPEASKVDSHWRRHLPQPLQRKQESTGNVVATAAGLGILGIVILIIVTIGTVLVGDAFGLPDTSTLIIGTIIGQYAGFIGLGLWYLRRRGFEWDRIWQYLGVRWPTLREVALGIGSWLIILLIIVVLGIAFELISQLFGWEAEQADQGLDDLVGDDPLIIVGIILLMFLVVGPAEELLFRGVIQGRLREHLPAVQSILIASALFAIIHVVALLDNPPRAIALAIFVLFATSLVIGWLYEFTQSLVAASLLHAFHNSMVTLLIYAQAVYGEDAILAPEWLTVAAELCITVLHWLVLASAWVFLV